MAETIIQEWTQSKVLLKYEEEREVRYRVYRNGDGVFQEICDLKNRPIHTQEMPDGLKLDRSSYEFMLRYVLLDVVAA